MYLSLSHQDIFTNVQGYVTKHLFIHHHFTQVRYTEILADESNVYMDGLSQPIECLVCSSNLIVCSDLSGDLQTWDIQTGETISQISRSPVHIDSMNADDDFKIQYQVKYPRKVKC